MGSGGVGPWLRAAGVCLAGVVLLMGGALVIRSSGWVGFVSTARFGGFRDAGLGWLGCWSHCWVLRERALVGVCCLQASVILPAGLVGGVVACGPVLTAIPHYARRVFFVGVVVWWWLWVGVRSCFENCIVDASIFF